MSNRPQESSISKPERVGRCGYQLFSARWPDGNVNFFAKVGLYYENKDTGEVYIIPKMYLGGASDHRRAGDEAEQKLLVIESSWHARTRDAPDAKLTLEFVNADDEQTISKSEAA